jgi:4-hydroxy-3-polyprenylbenzoate decarboxylase
VAVPECLKNLQGFENAKLVMPGIVALQCNRFTDAESTAKEINRLNEQCSNFINELERVPMVVICDNADFVSGSLRNFLWATFTRCNPSHDIHGIAPFTENKHWGCNGPMLLDARIKPHHAPPVETDPATEKKADRLFAKGGSLYGFA